MYHVTRSIFNCGEISREALLRPGIPVHVVPVPLPKARAVGGHEFDAAQPFRAFPEIEVREQKAQGIAVVGFEGEVVVLVRQHGIWVAQTICQRHIRGIVVFAV